MPTNGDVFLVPGDTSRPGLDGLLDKAIMWRTHSNKVHVIGYLSGFLYQDTYWHENGVLKTGVEISPYSASTVAGYERRSLKKPLSDQDVWALIRFGEYQHKRGFPYNDVMLVAFLLVYPLRKWLEKIGWIPFKKSIDFVCSVFWAEMLGFVGREVKPGIDPSMIVPGDFDSSPLYDNSVPG